jgi:UrcA family protein
MKGRIEMLSRVARLTAAVLSGVTASLLVTAATAQAAQDRPVVVYAEPGEGFRTERVSYRGLDLAIAKDQQALHRRVGTAVRRVCTEANHYRPSVDPIYRACTDDSWALAQPQISQAIARAEQLAMRGESSFAAGSIVISGR